MLDMNPYIHSGGIRGQLKDWEIFSKVNVQEGFGGLIWGNDLGYCSDSAFIASKPLPVDMFETLMEVYSAREKTSKKYKIAV
jgi:hypothetical protein